jgi:glutamyl-Q tRNA(Asp) synthetase
MANNSVKPDQYRGRFAPSPTGPLHFGSLASAVASYLQARSNHGIWLVRIEDIDPPREVPGSSNDILRTLEQHGLNWDDSVLYQSEQTERYLSALDSLDHQQLLYRCQCSRKTIARSQQQLGISIYPGTCRERRIESNTTFAIRIKTQDINIAFVDRIQGSHQQNLASDVGDFVLRRADGWIAYQLAVVVDDAFQGITEVVRGSDLLDNTPRQIMLQNSLSLLTPHYAHHPVAANQKGEKLSKQSHANPVDQTPPLQNLHKVLDFLGQNPPDHNDFSRPEELRDWAINHWNLKSVPNITQITISE